VTITLTDRLELRPMSLNDLPSMHAIHSDPAGWWFDPDGRHRDESETVALLQRSIDSWRADGLGYWTARRRSDAAVVGLGGVRRKNDTWNLAYRIAAEHQGNGYAVEIGRAGILAAHAADPGIPVIAWIDEANMPSVHVAEKLGLVARGTRADPTDGVARLVYADRELPSTASSAISSESRLVRSTSIDSDEKAPRS
jgi:RimJ/RimL family protein N-acetyltransferase